MLMRSLSHTHGRAASFNTPNRFEKTHLEKLDIEVPYDEEAPPLPTTFYSDTSRTILAKNDSPDLPFAYSVNPYRGCEHGCIYCYARPSHEYLGFSAGLDFETKIMVKMDAAELLAGQLNRRSWEPQMVALSGNTDCYQPAERKLLLTRRILEVFLDYRNPVSLITKNALVVRDIDIIGEMARLGLIHVMLSITTMDAGLARTMEPRTSHPQKRLDAIGELARCGVPVGVNVAPVVPGLTDEEIPAILSAARDHGATSASYILLKLPGAVEPLFLDWLNRSLPLRAGKIVSRIQDTRGGRLNDSRFGLRMTGAGEIAGAIGTLFALRAARLGLSTRWEKLSTSQFRRPSKTQLEIF